MSKKETYLVTGGAGFIGTNLVTELSDLGHPVVVVDNLSAGDASRVPFAVEFLEFDIRDTARLTAAMQNVDIVVHLAALPRVQYSIEFPLETQEVNVQGTTVVLEAARAAGVRRIVYAASSSAYGDQTELPLTVSQTAAPQSPYALHKCMGEQLMKMWSSLYGIETVSLRFFNVYGPHLDPDGAYALVIGRFLKLRKEGKTLTITGDGEQTRDFIHVSDVVSAILQSASSALVGNGEVLNIGYGTETSINELAAMIGGPTEHIAPRIEPKRTLADISETKRLLNWEPKTPLATGVTSLKAEFGLE